MMILFHFLESFVNTTAITSLSKFQHLFLTIVKLTLNLPICDMGTDLGVSTSTVSRVFTAWLDVNYTRLSPLIIWPSREELWTTMPLRFFSINILAQKLPLIVLRFSIISLQIYLLPHLLPTSTTIPYNF